MSETVTAPAPDAGGSGDASASPEVKKDDTGVQKAEERKYKVKYGKSEREVTEAELIAGYQKTWASDDRFKSAAQMKREAQEALEKGDLDQIIQKKFGKSKLEWAKEELKAELRRRTMTPEEREADERKSNIEKLRAEEEDLKAKAEERKLAEATRHYEEQYDKELSEAIKSEGLPKNKYAIGRAIKIASEVVGLGLEPDWNLVVREAKRQMQEEISELLDQAEDPAGFIGEERAKKIAKALVAKGMPKQEAAKVVKQAQAEHNNDPSIKKPADANDYWEKKRKEWSSK